VQQGMPAFVLENAGPSALHREWFHRLLAFETLLHPSRLEHLHPNPKYYAVVVTNFCRVDGKALAVMLWWVVYSVR
jgi:hypothetical protein